MLPTLDARFHRWLYLTIQRARRRPIARCLNQLQQWEQLDPEAYQALARSFEKRILRYAHSHVPLYHREPWRSALAGRDPANLNHWPVLEKQTVIDHTQQLHARPRPAGASLRFSSTSTGRTPTAVAVDPLTAAWSWAHEYRAIQWHGIDIGEPTLTGMHNMRRSPRETPLLDWIRNRRGYFADHLDPHKLDQLVHLILHQRVQFCWGLPSVIFQLARHLRARHPDAPAQLVKAVKLGGEPLYPFQRHYIAQALGAHVAQNYGCTEVGPIATECPRGNMHLFTTHTRIEIFHNHQPAPRGEFGDIVATSLGNLAMPLVRCRIGDKARLSPQPCPCGLPTPVIEQLTSRRGDTLFDTDHQPHHASTLGNNLHHLFSHLSPRQARQIQCRQRDFDHWHILLEADVPPDENTQHHIRSFIQHHFGRSARIHIQHTAFIPREPSGKFRYYRTMTPAPHAETDLHTAHVAAT